MPTAPLSPSTLPAGGRLLIVDDEVELLTVLRETLSREGFEVVGLTSGDAALAALREQPVFDLLLTDLMMPGLDGLGLLKAALEIDPQLVCVMMTGQGTVQTAVDAMKVGAFDYVLKPFKLSAMLPVLTRAMEARRLRVENLQLRETVAIYELAQTLAVTLDAEAILTKLADAALQQSQADEASVMLPAPEGEGLVVAAVRGAGRGYLAGERVPLATGIAGWAARFREMLELKGEVRDPHFTPIHPRPEIRQALSVPMLAGNDFIGVLNVNVTRQRRPFTLRDAKALSILAGLGAAALQNAHLLAEVQADEKRFRALIQNAPDAITLLDADGTVRYDSPAAQGLLGYGPEELLGTNAFERIHPDDRAATQAVLQQLVETPGVKRSHTFRFRHKNGDWLWMEAAGSNMLAEPSVQAIVVNYRDITERTAAQDALRESEYRYRDLIEHIHDLICTHDLEGQILSANQSASRMLGYEPHELTGKNLREILAPEVRHEFDDYLSTIRQKGAAHGLMLVETRSGERRIWEYDNSLRTEGVSAPIVRGFARDITERRRAEEEIKQKSEDLLLINSLNEAANRGESLQDITQLLSTNTQRMFACRGATVYLLSEDKKYLVMQILNIPLTTVKQIETLIGMKIPGTRIALTEQSLYRKVLQAGKPQLTNDPQIIQRFMADFTDNEMLRRVIPQIRRLLDISSMISIPLISDSEIVGLLDVSRKEPFTDSDVHRLAVISEEISAILQRKRAEKALRESEERYRTLIEQASDGIFVANSEGQYVDVNTSGCAMLGYSREELLGLHLNDLLSAEDLTTAPPRLDKLRAGKIVLNERRLKRKDGTELPVEISAKMLPDGRLQGIARDITERKQAEAAIQHQLTELKVLHTIATLGVEAPDEDVLIEKATLAIGEALYPDNFGVLLLDEAVGSLRLHPSYRGVPDAIRHTLIPLGRGITGRVAATGQPRRIGDAAREADFLNFEIGVRSELCVPLKVGERVIGVVNTESTAPDAFSEADERLLVTVASQLATAIERLRREAAERDRARELEALAQVSAALRVAQTRAEMLPVILDQVETLFHTPHTGLALRDPATNETVRELARGQWTQATGLRLPPGEGIGGLVIATGQLYRNDDVLTDPRASQPQWVGEARAVVAVPLITRDQTIGALWVGRRTPFVEREVRLLTAIGDMAANAIHRASLHEQTEQRLQHLTALRAVDVAISSSLDLRVTLGVLLDQTMTQLHVNAADILLLSPTLHTLDYAAGRGFRGSAITRSHLRLGECQAGRAALERRTIYLPNLAEATTFVRAGLLAGENFVAHYVTPLIAKGQVKGVLEVFHRAPLAPDPEWLDFLEALGGQAAIAIDNSELFDGLQRSNVELALAYDATIEGWSHALDLRDRETEGHTLRVTELTLRLAREMGIDDAELVHIRWGALLHDIGKMGVPDAILLKPGKLTDEEWVVMRRHPQFAYEMLSPITYLRPALDIPYCHHEKWDGTGYPRGLKGERIPPAARIFAVVDVYDALRSDRPYRPGWSEEKVREYIREQARQHFDPQVVELFLTITATDETRGSTPS